MARRRVSHYRVALELTENPVEQRFLQARIDGLQQQDADDRLGD